MAKSKSARRKKAAHKSSGSSRSLHQSVFHQSSQAHHDVPAKGWGVSPAMIKQLQRSRDKMLLDAVSSGKTPAEAKQLAHAFGVQHGLEHITRSESGKRAVELQRARAAQREQQARGTPTIAAQHVTGIAPTSHPSDRGYAGSELPTEGDQFKKQQDIQSGKKPETAAGQGMAAPNERKTTFGEMPFEETKAHADYEKFSKAHPELKNPMTRQAAFEKAYPEHLSPELRVQREREAAKARVEKQRDIRSKAVASKEAEKRREKQQAVEASPEYKAGQQLEKTGYQLTSLSGRVLPGRMSTMQMIGALAGDVAFAKRGGKGKFESGSSSFGALSDIRQMAKEMQQIADESGATGAVAERRRRMKKVREYRHKQVYVNAAAKIAKVLGNAVVSYDKAKASIHAASLKAKTKASSFKGMLKEAHQAGLARMRTEAAKTAGKTGGHGWQRGKKGGEFYVTGTGKKIYKEK